MQALILGFYSSGYDFAIPSSRLYLKVQTLGVALRFVGNNDAGTGVTIYYGTFDSNKNLKNKVSLKTYLYSGYVPTRHTRKWYIKFNIPLSLMMNYI